MASKEEVFAMEEALVDWVSEHRVEIIVATSCVPRQAELALRLFDWSAEYNGGPPVPLYEPEDRSALVWLLRLAGATATLIAQVEAVS
jgi:hypothetical protein